MKRSSLADRACPVSRAVSQRVDAWTFVILRDLFLGNRRFQALRLHTGMSPRSLALRLDRLVGQDILTKRLCRAAFAAEVARPTARWAR